MRFPSSPWLLVSLWAIARPAATIHLEPGFTSSSPTFTGFRTEPTLAPEQFHIQRIVEDKSRLAPGFIFIDPIWDRHGWGPQIYSIDGELVWSGSSEFRTQNLHVCDFLGQIGTHLCVSRRNDRRRLPKSIYGPGKRPSARYIWNVVFDQTYTAVANFTRAAVENLPLNPHAFETPRGGKTSLSLYARPARIDLTPYGGIRKGWVSNQCFEEINMRTRRSIFNWCYLESGLEVWQTKMFFNHTKAWRSQHPENLTSHIVGKGLVDARWDFLHFNAIDKNSQGDYYLSVRHLDQIIKIAGPDSSSKATPGTVLWRLGGKANDFDLQGFPSPEDPPFSRQHDVRSISVSDTEEVISLLNNAFDGVFRYQKYSDAQFIHLDLKTMTATLRQILPQPNKHLSQGRGSTQQLANGNTFVGWGRVPEMTEFDPNGTVLYHARLRLWEYTDSHFKHQRFRKSFTYRTFKYPWMGKPKSKPKLVFEISSCSFRGVATISPSVAYVSWNGATEVVNWQFYASVGGSWVSTGVFQKRGFETKVQWNASTITFSSPHVKVEALDVNNRVLGSTTAKVSLPSPCKWATMVSTTFVLFLGACIETAVFGLQWGLHSGLHTYTTVATEK